MTTPRPTCESCPYWTKTPRWGGAEVGECRRRAPTFSPDKIGEQSWAPALPADWCGEHPQMPAYIAGLAGGGDALREAVLATVPAMVDRLGTIERREGSDLSLSAVQSLDECQDQLQALLDLAGKDTP